MTDHIDGQVVSTAATTPKPQRSTTLPADRETAGAIARLLLHYPIGGMSDAARTAMAEDWLDDLREFGPEVVAEACREWRRQPGGRRPTPGDIRALCVDVRASRQGALPAAIPVLTDEEAMAQADKWAQGHGFACIEAAQRAGHSVAVRVGPGRFKTFQGLPRYPKAPLEPVGGFAYAGPAIGRVAESAIAKSREAAE